MNYAIAFDDFSLFFEFFSWDGKDASFVMDVTKAATFPTELEAKRACDRLNSMRGRPCVVINVIDYLRTKVK